MEQKNNRSKRGFAAMTKEKQREIASKGGRAAHASGHAHEFTSEEAKAAGRKGGRRRTRIEGERDPSAVPRPLDLEGRK